MNLRRLNLLDWVLGATVALAVGVVVYRYYTQRYLDWPSLGYTAIGIIGYTRYRTTRSKPVTNDASARIGGKGYPSEGMLERAGFVFVVGWSTLIVAAMLAFISYASASMHRTGQAVFAAGGSLLTAYFASRYFRDARRLRLRNRNGQ